MLTDLTIAKMPPPATRREVPDGKIRGLYLQVTPNGAKSWTFRYRAAGEQRKLTLGPYPAIDLKSARRLAEKARGEVAHGADPAAQKQAQRAAAKTERERDEDMVENVVAQFIERHAKPNTRDWKNTEGLLKREVVARWKGKRLGAITRPMVHAMLDEIIDRGAPVRANRALAQFRKMVNWAVSRGLVATNPFLGLAAPTKETKRERVLSDDEIRLAWQAFESVGWPFGQLAKLLLLTGARLREVAEAPWVELDLKTQTWTMPPARTKNKREHVVPLSEQALTLIESLPRIAGAFVFTTTGKTPVSGFSKAKRAIDAAVTDLNDGAALPPWTLHDLRRTVATNLQKMGVRLEVTEAVLNHASGSRGGIVGVYQRHDWADEKRAALDAWARRLNEIVSGEAAPSNVVELKAK
jgi:integrase